ncbi:MAG: DUF1697 domain-containing protein [Bacteroidales bacterium]|nr:DUF1697 domain-containing protein [Bacteroidales bacterium]
MQTLVSFLRGVNMAGHNKIKMTDLIVLFKKLGFKDAETYIQSGNVIFSKPVGLTTKEIASKIEGAINRKFGYSIAAIVRTEKELRKAVAVNPFLSEKDFDPAKMAVLFLAEEPSSDQIARVAKVDYPPDKFRISGSEIYIYCPNGFGKTKIYTGFFENKMKVVGTGRNWKTINTLLKLLKTGNSQVSC